MKRRDFVKGAAATVGMTSVAAPAVAQSRREFRVVGFEGGDLTSAYTGQSTNRFFSWLENATNGDLVFSPYEGEVPEDGEFGIASRGEAHAYYAGEYHWVNEHVLFRLFGGSMPMGLSIEEFMGWFYHRGGERMWNDLSEQFNIKAFAARTAGHQLAGWFTEEVRSVEDFRGKSMDMPGVIGYIMSHLGADADDYILEGPIVEALHTGEIYAAEKSNPVGDMPEGYHTGVNYYYPEIIHEPHTFTALGFNLETWESLSSTQQQAVENVSMAHLAYSMAESTALNAAALRSLTEEHGLEIKRFPERSCCVSASSRRNTYVRRLPLRMTSPSAWWTRTSPIGTRCWTGRRRRSATSSRTGVCRSPTPARRRTDHLSVGNVSLIAIGASLGLATSVPVWAHHSFAANFLMNEEITIEAVVTDFRVANPHSLILVDAINEAGETEQWVVETGTPTRLRNAGWSSRTLPAGTKITVFGHPTRSGAPTLALVKIVFEDGTELLAP